MSQTPEIAARIDQFESQATVLQHWIQGLSPAELTSRPVPGKWTVQELVVHMLDSDIAAGHRMRRIAAEQLPLLIAYDENAFAANLHYHAADLSQVADLFRLNRLFTASWLRTVPAADFARTGVHNHRGTLSLIDMLGLYIRHVTHHQTFLVEKRSVLGKPLA